MIRKIGTMVVLGVLIVGVAFTSGCVETAPTLIEAPKTSLTIVLDEVNDQGVFFSIALSVQNPNPFSITLKDLRLVLHDDTGAELGSMYMEGGDVPSQEAREFDGKAQVGFGVLNAERVITSLSGVVGAAGIEKELDIETSATIKIPSMSRLFASPQIKSEVTLKIGVPTATADIKITITNPNDLSFGIGDTSITMYDKYGAEISSGIIPGKTIPAKGTAILEGTITIPYDKLTNPVKTKVETSVGLSGVEETIPISTTITTSVELGLL